MRKIILTPWTIELLRLCQIVSLPPKLLNANRRDLSLISCQFVFPPLFKLGSNITEVLTTLIQEQKNLLFQIEKRQKELVSYFLYTVHCWCLTRGVNLKHLFSAAGLFQANVECLLSCQGFIVIRHYSSQTDEFWEGFQKIANYFARNLQKNSLNTS